MSEKLIKPTAIVIAEEAMQTAMDMDTRDGAKLDECAVRLLAEYQVEELAAKRAKGYGGWEQAGCTLQHLSDLFHAQVAKGNIIGAANYLAFLHARNETTILPETKAVIREKKIVGSSTKGGRVVLVYDDGTTASSKDEVTWTTHSIGFVESYDGTAKVYYNENDELTTSTHFDPLEEAHTERNTYVNGELRMREEKTTSGGWVVTFPVVEVRDSGVPEVTSDERGNLIESTTTIQFMDKKEPVEIALSEKSFHEFTQEEIDHYAHRASLKPGVIDGGGKLLSDDIPIATALFKAPSFIGQLAPGVIYVGQPPAGENFSCSTKIDVAIADADAPALEGCFSLTDAELLALNDGEVYFSSSPLSYPESGFGTQYRVFGSGILGFARAAIALATSKETEAIAFNVDYLGADLPTVHVILKNGTIVATNDEPGQLDGVWSIPYRPMRDEDDGVLLREMYDAVAGEDAAFLGYMDKASDEWEDSDDQPTFDQFRNAIRGAVLASRAAAAAGEGEEV